MVQNPQLTKALFQAQVLLGMVPAPGTGGPLQPPPAQGQQQQQPSPQYQQAPPAQQQPSPQYQQPAAQYGQPQYLQPAPAANGAPPAMYAAPGAYVPPPVQHHAGPAADPYAAQQAPQPAQQHQYGAPQLQQPVGYQQAPPAQHQVDPRYQAAPSAVDPRQQQQQPQAAPGAQSALDQHKGSCRCWVSVLLTVSACHGTGKLPMHVSQGEGVCFRGLLPSCKWPLKLNFASVIPPMDHASCVAARSDAYAKPAQAVSLAVVKPFACFLRSVAGEGHEPNAGTD